MQQVFADGKGRMRQGIENEVGKIIAPSGQSADDELQ